MIGFWDFRNWRSDTQTRRDYLDKFSQHNIIAMILLNQEEELPFTDVRNFLKAALEKNVGVWIRTNRVTPKRGTPGYFKGTLDFALNPEIQEQVFNYLEQIANLTKDFSNLKGIVIGSEEMVGMGINKEELERWKNVLDQEAIVDLSNPSIIDKENLFDWIQEKNNDWYERIWKVFSGKYPQLDLFIWPSTVAITESRFSSYPRPAYWDIYDLIVNRKAGFKIILASYNVFQEDGLLMTECQAMFLYQSVEELTDIYFLQQCHEIEEGKIPTKEQMLQHAKAAMDNYVSGIGYWPMDILKEMDIYSVNQERWNQLFEVIEEARVYFDNIWYSFNKYDILIKKDKYSWFVGDKDIETAFQAFINFKKLGYHPTFTLKDFYE